MIVSILGTVQYHQGNTIDETSDASSSFNPIPWYMKRQSAINRYTTQIYSTINSTIYSTIYSTINDNTAWQLPTCIHQSIHSLSLSLYNRKRRASSITLLYHVCGINHKVTWRRCSKENRGTWYPWQSRGLQSNHTARAETNRAGRIMSRGRAILPDYLILPDGIIHWICAGLWEQ